MKKIFTLSSALLCAAATVATAAVPVQKAESVVGRFGEPAKTAPAKARVQTHLDVPPSAVVEVLLSEDFSKWTAGTEENPDPTILELSDDEATPFMSVAGNWIIHNAQQAGGVCYLGIGESEDGSPDPGYIWAPNVDATSGQGVFRVTCRAKNVNETEQGQNIQGMFFDMTPTGDMLGTIHLAYGLEMTYNEWKDFEWNGTLTVGELGTMILGWQGKVLIDDLKIEHIIYPIETPQVKPLKMAPTGELKVAWEPVEGATSYRVTVSNDEGTLFTGEYGNVTEAIVPVYPQLGDAYTASVRAISGEDFSYDGSVHTDEIAPDEIGDVAALAATDVTENGFTANWERADYATNYALTTKRTRVAQADGEEYVIYEDDFTNIPTFYDEYNALMVMPLMGMGGKALDLYLGRSGWSVDLGILFRQGANLVPGFDGIPALVLTNMYAAMGLPGQFSSPAANYAVGNGTIKISGTGQTAEDDMVIRAGFINSANQFTQYEDFEVSTDGAEFEFEVTGGQDGDRIAFRIVDAADEDMVMIKTLKITTTLNAGETITTPYTTFLTDGGTTSCPVEVELGPNDQVEYSVIGYFSPEIASDPSESVVVKLDNNAIASVKKDAQASFRTNGCQLTVVNPAAAAVEVYAVDGRLVARNNGDASATFTLAKGVYVVTVGAETFKVKL